MNCKKKGKEANDIHISLGKSLTADQCDTITAEMTPHFRPDTWTPENLNHAEHRPVRITGQLFFDGSHVPCRPSKPANPRRSTVWEVHPVYAVDVCRKSSLGKCKAEDESVWVALDE